MPKHDDGDAPKKAVPLTDRSDEKLQRHLVRLTTEYKALAAAPQTAAVVAELREIGGELRTVQRVLESRQPKIEVQMHRTATGFNYRIGDTEYPPGPHIVSQGVAQMLLWMMDQDRQAEIRRMTQNGRTVNLGDVNSQARQIEQPERRMGRE